MPQRQASYTMPSYSQPSPSPRYSSSQNTSSAFSASANPNEDWTKISDLAERRRIQNRIAQRNYRLKIKRKLENLEKQATSPSPERAHAELAHGRHTGNDAGKRRRSKPEPRARVPEPITAPPPFTPDMKTDFSADHFVRELSESPPPFSQPYSLPDPNVSAAYYPSAGVSAMPASYPEYSVQQSYYQLPPLPTMLPTPPPSMQSYESAKSTPSYYESDDMMSQYSMASYTPFTTSMEMPIQTSYAESTIHTPPLSHSHSFDESRDGSPALAFPGTPTSLADSPKLMFRC